MIIGYNDTSKTEDQDMVLLQPESEEFPEEAGDNRQLEKDLGKTKKSAYSPGMLHNFMCQWRSYIHFAKRYRVSEWPVTEHTICLFAQHLAYTFKSAKAVKNYVYGLRTLHVLTQTTPPNLKHPEIKLTFRGLNKVLTHEVKRAQPLTPDILLDVLQYLNLNRHVDRVFWALLLTGFFGMLCKSNLIPDSKDSFDPVKQLTRGHVSFVENLAVIRVT